jgi:hypothetical protein
MIDKELLAGQVHDVIRYSQHLHGINLYGVRDIINKWYENKSFFIDKMGGKLIYEIPDITFTLNQDGKDFKIDRFSERVSDYYKNFGLATFLDELRTNDFFNNLTSRKYVIDVDEEESVVIPEGYKVIKAFKFFEPCEDILKQIQNEASQIIQENVVSGTLCFSVHPLDYLSISENVCNWRSCHALDGDYRSGNLNYMVDRATVVCYLRSDKQAILPRFPEHILWNSKKWRILLFFSEDYSMLFAGRQYPFVAENALDVIRKHLLYDIDGSKWSAWHNKRFSIFEEEETNTTYCLKSMIPVGNVMKPLNRIVVDGQNTHHFNDLLRSTVYTPYWSYKESYNWWDSTGTGLSSESTTVKVGEACLCPVCGDYVIDFSETMMCSRCNYKYDYNNNSDDYVECQICGAMVHEDDTYRLTYSDLEVCRHCYENETAECQECGAIDIVDLIYYREDTRRCLCNDCASR